MTTYSNHDKAKEALREAGQRRSVYPRWVEDGRITAKEAARRLSIMIEIADEYRRLAEEDKAREQLL